MTRLDTLWARHDAEWRDPAEVASQWETAGRPASDALRLRVRGRFWEVLDRTRATLLVTREYEHLLVGLTVSSDRPHITYMRLPHPSGLVYDAERAVVHVASTRNPNQLFELAPVEELERRRDVPPGRLRGRPLVPLTSRFYPGCMYLHDLSLVGGVLHANAVGENAVVRLEEDGRFRRVWWPRCVETANGPLFERNHLQLNSIAAGPSLKESFFSASTDEITSRRPGHRNFPVNGRGVIFSGKTREPVARGLTRPHSARLNGGKIWVANSGYGELGFIDEGRFEAVVRLNGWTRGLAFSGDIAWVGTSRIIPRFERYAPGLDAKKSECAVHAVDRRSGKVLGSAVWPGGNQIFAIDWAPRSAVSGFAFSARAPGSSEAAKRLFYAFRRNRERGT
jgi:uncharacterized protein (TIGR03032 family)